MRRCLDSIVYSSTLKGIDFFIFVDGARRGDEQKVEDVKTVIREFEYVNRFIDLKVVCNDLNRGSRLQVEKSLEYIKGLGYTSYILVEDDIVFSPLFIEYCILNLLKYQNEESILTIAGFSPVVHMKSEVPKGLYRSFRFAPWGYASWFSRDLLLLEYSDFDLFFSFGRNAKISLKHLCSSGLDVLPNIYWSLYTDRPIGNDYRVILRSVFDGKYHLHTSRSYTLNIGLDGSGENCRNLNLLLFNEGMADSVISEGFVVLDQSPEYVFSYTLRRYFLTFLLRQQIVYRLFKNYLILREILRK